MRTLMSVSNARRLPITGAGSGPRPNPSGQLLRHTLDDEGTPFRYLLAHRQEILERR
jgi:hypothetical protein